MPNSALLTSETIRKRVSCRTFKAEALSDNHRGNIEEALRANIQGPFGNRVRFELVDLTGTAQAEIKTLGTYGFIQGARFFIVGAVQKGNRAMEDFGYCMEMNILAATNLGLGTCWLGGTFNRSASAARIRQGEGEVVPAITPIGYPKERKSITDSAIRLLAKSSGRKPWEELFFHGDTRTPLTRSIAGSYELALECVRLGPSASNRQPWRVIKDQEQDLFHFYLNRTPGYAQKYGGNSLQDIDMGIALCHFEIGAREMRHKGSWKILSIAPRQSILEYIASWVEEPLADLL